MSLRPPLAVFAWLALVPAGAAVAYEEPAFTVVEKDGPIELRQYEPRIVAETRVSGEFSDFGSEAFRRLAGYIGGRNRAKSEIAMTAPVTQEPASEKIAMTAPVTQESDGGDYRITFVMPAKYTLDTLPEPLDERVELVSEPGQLVAALRYSGTWSQKRYRERQARLEAWIAQRGLVPVGEPVFARYDPPFMPWFWRRNEVWIPVERPAE